MRPFVLVDRRRPIAEVVVTDSEFYQLLRLFRLVRIVRELGGDVCRPAKPHKRAIALLRGTVTPHSCLGSKHAPVVDTDSKAHLFMRKMLVYDMLANAVYQHRGVHRICVAVGIVEEHHHSVANRSEEHTSELQSPMYLV